MWVKIIVFGSFYCKFDYLQIKCGMCVKFSFLSDVKGWDKISQRQLKPVFFRSFCVWAYVWTNLHTQNVLNNLLCIIYGEITQFSPLLVCIWVSLFFIFYFIYFLLIKYHRTGGASMGYVKKEAHLFSHANTNANKKNLKPKFFETHIFVYTNIGYKYVDAANMSGCFFVCFIVSDQLFACSYVTQHSNFFSLKTQ